MNGSLTVKYSDTHPVKETVEEEIWGVVYYALAIANCYNIDLENIIKQKEEINNDKYKTGVCLDPQ